MPDFFHGKPFDINSHPPDTDEKKAKFQAFFEGPADISKAKENSEKLVKSLSKQFSVQKWASLGMCWGAKVGPGPCLDYHVEMFMLICLTLPPGCELSFTEGHTILSRWRSPSCFP